MISASIFMMEGEKIGKFGKATRRDKARRFRSHFGITPLRCSLLWEKLALPHKAEPMHLLCALLFLRSYQTEDRLASMAGVTEKTFQMWMWKLVMALSKLNNIKWWNGYLGWEHRRQGQSVT